MNHRLLAAAAALLLTTGLAMAQTTSPVTGDPTEASDLKGPPNANGYGSDTGLEKGSTVIGGAGSSGAEAPSAKNMKGSPNADGYKK